MNAPPKQLLRTIANNLLAALLLGTTSRCTQGQVLYFFTSELPPDAEGDSEDTEQEIQDAAEWGAPNYYDDMNAASQDELPPIAFPPAGDAQPPAPQIDAPAASGPPQAQGAHAPTILNVDIAREIPANGTRVGGTIIFEDAGQDVTLLRADVLAATLHAESWTYDPRENMVWSGNRGIAAFQVWCTGDPQDVSYSFTLQDSAGSFSPPWRVDYTCK